MLHFFCFFLLNVFGVSALTVPLMASTPSLCLSARAAQASEMQLWILSIHTCALDASEAQKL